MITNKNAHRISLKKKIKKLTGHCEENPNDIAAAMNKNKIKNRYRKSEITAILK